MICVAASNVTTLEFFCETLWDRDANSHHEFPKDFRHYDVPSSPEPNYISLRIPVILLRAKYFISIWQTLVGYFQF